MQNLNARFRCTVRRDADAQGGRMLVRFELAQVTVVTSRMALDGERHVVVYEWITEYRYIISHVSRKIYSLHNLEISRLDFALHSLLHSLCLQGPVLHQCNVLHYRKRVTLCVTHSVGGWCESRCGDIHGSSWVLSMCGGRYRGRSGLYSILAFPKL